MQSQVPLLPQHLAATMLKKPNRTEPKHTSRSSISQNVRTTKSATTAHAVPSSLAAPKHALVLAATKARIQSPSKREQVKKRRLHRNVHTTNNEVPAHAAATSLAVQKHALVLAATKVRIQSHTHDGCTSRQRKIIAPNVLTSRIVTCAASLNMPKSVRGPADAVLQATRRSRPAKGNAPGGLLQRSPPRQLLLQLMSPGIAARSDQVGKAWMQATSTYAVWNCSSQSFGNSNDCKS